MMYRILYWAAYTLSSVLAGTGLYTILFGPDLWLGVVALVVAFTLTFLADIAYGAEL